MIVLRRKIKLFCFQQGGSECVGKRTGTRDMFERLYYIVYCAAEYGIHFFKILHRVLFSKN